MVQWTRSHNYSLGVTRFISVVIAASFGPSLFVRLTIFKINLVISIVGLG